MKRYVCLFIITAIYFVIPLTVTAQEEKFGFDEEESSSESPFALKIGGTVSIGGYMFFNDFKQIKNVKPGLPVSAFLHLHSAAPYTEAGIGVRLSNTTLPIQLSERYKTIPQSPIIPLWIDHAYLKLLFDHMVISAGIQKITWGRAESYSILDRINPHDKTQIPPFNGQNSKIPIPFMSIQAYLPHGIKWETVFLPIFQGNRLACTGRWKDSRIDKLLKKPLAEAAYTATLAYAQAGTRFTFSIGTHDFAIQYLYGRLHDFVITAQNKIDYNQYHHIGMDYGTALARFDIFAELAANITANIKGTNDHIFKPFFEWNTGIAYNAPYGFRLLTAARERITLKKIDNRNIQGEKNTQTHLLFSITHSFLRGAMEWNLKTDWNIEDRDFYLRAGIRCMFAAFVINGDIGFFGGNSTGSYGSFAGNHFIKVAISYSF